MSENEDLRESKKKIITLPTEESKEAPKNFNNVSSLKKFLKIIVVIIKNQKKIHQKTKIKI